MKSSFITTRLLSLPLTLLWALAAVLAQGQSVEEKFQLANEQLNKLEYENAVKSYLDILHNHQYHSAALYNNLACAYFKITDYPSAILYFEKAIKWQPNNEQIKQNLALANSRILDKIEALPIIFYKRWWQQLSLWLLPNVWYLLFAVFWLLLSTGIVAYMLGVKPKIRKIGFFLASVSIIPGLICFLLARSAASFRYAQTHAIVFASSLSVKASPNENATDLFVIHGGTKVKKIDAIGEWTRITLEDGKEGWTLSDALEWI